MPTNTVAVVCIRPGVGSMGAEALRWAPVGIECGREKYIDGAPQGYRVPTNTMVGICIRPGVGGMGAEALRWAIWVPRHWAEEEI